MNRQLKPSLEFAHSRTERVVDFVSRHFLFLVTVLSLLSYGTVYLADCFGPPIRADGAGYHIYLPSILLYNDLSFERVAVEQYEGRMPSWTGVRRHPVTGRYVDKYNAGVAFMALPFFLAAHGVTWLMRSPPGGFDWWRFQYPLDGYSFFYQHAAGLSGVFYFLAGLWLLQRFLDERFSRGVTILTLFVLLFGTNLFHYGTGESVLTHPYSFFIICVLFHLVPRWHRSEKNGLVGVTIGLCLGLSALLRTPGILAILLPLGYGAQEFAVKESRRKWLSIKLRGGMLMAACVVLVMIPQLLIWRYSTGSYLVNTYRAETPNLFQPRILDILFGLNKGILFWSPILVFVIPGFHLMRRDLPAWWLAALVFVCANVYLIASYELGWIGGGLGQRYVVELYPVLAMPLACFLARVQSAKFKWLVYAVMLLMVMHVLFMMKLYYTREISFFGLDRQALFDILWLRKEYMLQVFRSLRF